MEKKVFPDPAKPTSLYGYVVAETTIDMSLTDFDFNAGNTKLYGAVTVGTDVFHAFLQV